MPETEHPVPTPQDAEVAPRPDERPPSSAAAPGAPAGRGARAAEDDVPPGPEAEAAADEAADAAADEGAAEAGSDVEAEEASDDDEPGGDEEPDGDPGTGGPRSRGRRRRDEPTPVPPDRLEGAVEALLLASGDVLTPERLRDLLGLPSVLPVKEAVEAVSRRWSGGGSAVEVQAVAGGWRVSTRPEYAEYVRRLARRPAGDRLTPSLLETLSIVAYRQPVARVEVERIRGVQAGDALRGLLDRRLVKVVGRSDQPGRPLLYGTTRRFLEAFGLASLRDLPAHGDLKQL